MFDVAVIGGGPAGLSAAVSAASEGLDTVVLYGCLGGQAGSSSLIENYLGFPAGISGPALAGRARRQALKFGACFVPGFVDSVEANDGSYRVCLEKGTMIRSRTIIMATGASYNKLASSTDYDRFEGRGIHYACTPSEVRRKCRCNEVVVVGGGNSAGQAAAFLATKAKHVHLLVRRDNLSSTMSDYLLRRILENENITVHLSAEIVSIDGNGWVESVTWRDPKSGVMERRDISDVYVMIGASPNCGFIHPHCEVDDHGFIVTDDRFRTSAPGLFAVGDVRSGSVKRCANAAGEGATAIKWLWKELMETAA